MKKKTLFFDMIRACMQNKRTDLTSNPLYEVGMQIFEESGMTNLIPNDRSFPLVTNRATLANIAGEMPILDIPALTDYLVLTKAGMRFYPGYDGMIPNVIMPYSNVPTVADKAENDSADDANITMGKLTFGPNRFTCYTDFSKQLAVQGGLAGEKYVLDLILAAIAAKFEGSVLGKAAGTTTKPQGIFYKNTFGTDSAAASVVPTRTNLLAMEAELDANKALRGSLAWITSGTGARLLKTTAKETGQDRFLFEDGKMLEYPLYFSSNVPNTCGSGEDGSGIVLANWNDLIAVQFADLVITVDPFVRAIAGIIRLTVSGFFDAKGARGTSLTSSDESTDPCDYATSFAMASIKAE